MKKVRRMLELKAQGMTGREVARALLLSPDTVRQASGRVGFRDRF
jgi:DNA-binding CsgD family transcriptional regulator